MIRRFKEWWYGPEKYRRAGVEITEDGILYKKSIDILKSPQGKQQLQAFCDLEKKQRKYDI